MILLVSDIRQAVGWPVLHEEGGFEEERKDHKGKLLGNMVFQIFPMIMQDLSRRCIATRGESVSTYPRRPKAEAFSMM